MRVGAGMVDLDGGRAHDFYVVGERVAGEGEDVVSLCECRVVDVIAWIKEIGHAD